MDAIEALASSVMEMESNTRHFVLICVPTETN